MPSTHDPEPLMTALTHPASISYYDYTRKQRLAVGIKDGLIRLALGVENKEDLIEDIRSAIPNN